MEGAYRCSLGPQAQHTHSLEDHTWNCDLRAKLLVACLVTPALWLNLSDSRNILIIHFGLLLKERTLDSIGHDLCKKYNVSCLLWMIRDISLLTNIFTQWILIDALWGSNSPLPCNGVDTMMTLDAAKWNGTGGELSSCVINTSIRSCIIIFETLSEQIYQLIFYPFLFYVLIYMFIFLMYCDLHAYFAFSTYI